MPRYYYYPEEEENPYGVAFGRGLSKGLTGALERSLEEKARKKKLREDLKIKGYSRYNAEPDVEDKINLGTSDVPEWYAKPLTELEKAKQAYDIRKYQKPEPTFEEKMEIIRNMFPKGKYPEGLKITEGGVTIPLGEPTLEQEVEKKRKLTRATEEAKMGYKKEVLAKDIGDFLTIDEQIPRGKGLGRFGMGVANWWEGIKQDSPEGMAVAAHDAASKRLRVQLVRAAGDVGNINIVEQEAAEKIIPKLSDSESVAQLKRVYLQQLVKAIDERNSDVIKSILSHAGVNYSGQDKILEFNSEQEAINANLPSGTKIRIGGRDAIWE